MIIGCVSEQVSQPDCAGCELLDRQLLVCWQREPQPREYTGAVRQHLQLFQHEAVVDLRHGLTGFSKTTTAPRPLENTLETIPLTENAGIISLE
jgi:hypothetical protein